ncbi:complement C1q-like protein 3 isoform X1 [Mytilus trossulus]|uniref:complement C1q-like protein 3 isoform X1 n=1 Tax=Mytilus trossulus TaxID=6551 RepID=UPI003007C3B2
MACSGFIFVLFVLTGVSVGVDASCNAKRGKTTCVTEDLLEMLIRINSRKSGSDENIKSAFYASLKGDVSLSDSNKVLKFEDVRVNRGRGYDSSTGIFTATRDGLYHFSCVIYGDRGDDIGYQLNKNESIYVKGYSNNGAYEASTLSVLMELKKGDRVYIQHRHKGNTDKVIGSDHSSFGGYFLQE